MKYTLTMIFAFALTFSPLGSSFLLYGESKTIESFDVSMEKKQLTEMDEKFDDSTLIWIYLNPLFLLKNLSSHYFQFHHFYQHISIPFKPPRSLFFT